MTAQKITDSTKSDAIIYLRVSTEEQVDNFSLDTQEEICRKEAGRRGLTVVKVFREEGKSAKTITGRPTLIALLQYCRSNKKSLGAVLVYRLDRLSRQTSDYLSIRKNLIDCNIQLISASEPTGTSPTETLLETILASFAQHDNDVRSERTTNGMRARFLSGLITGKAPLGYKMVNKFPVEDPNTWELVKQAWDLMATGTKTLREMTDIMNQMGLSNFQCGTTYPLRIQAAHRLFRNKFYAGILTSKAYPEEVRGQQRPMITIEQYYQVQQILSGRCTRKNASAIKSSRNNDVFPLRRIIKCAGCGRGLTAGWSKGRTKRYPYYRCAGGCHTTSIRAEKLDEAIADLLNSVSPKPECLELFTKYVTEEYDRRLSKLKTAQNRADGDIEKLLNIRKALVEKNLLGIYTDEIFLEQNALLEKKMIAASMVKSTVSLERYNIERLTNFVNTTLSNLGETYKRSTVPQIKALLGSIFPSGISINFDGTLNHEINPMYQTIFAFADQGLSFGDPMGNRTPVTRMKTLCPNH